MNFRCETVKMAVPPGNPQGVGSEAYLKSTSRRAQDPRKPGRTAISAVAAGDS
jgi:hypothetical protein